MKKSLSLIPVLAALTTFAVLTAACSKTDDPQQQKDSPDYLYFEAVEAGATVAVDTLVFGGNVAGFVFPSLEYSNDLSVWTKYDFENPHTVTLENTGDKVYWRNTGKTNLFSSDDVSVHFNLGQKKIAAGGNIMSLIDKTCESLTIPSGYCFNCLFLYESALVKAPELPATELTDWCYYCMFAGCSSLQKAPKLPATKLAEGCYAWMLGKCTSLEEAPELPSTELAPYCYQAMLGYTNLRKGPELPATELEEYCYSWLFQECPLLEESPELPATKLDTACYYCMFYDCPSLAAAPDLPAKELAYLCYEGIFCGCSSLQRAPELPATELSLRCYDAMFYDCLSLLTAPELPATKLAEGCYYGMFIGCSSLENAPDLPATALDKSCYSLMFYDCPSLETAPELPATKLADGCYMDMFAGCTSLSHIKVSFEDWGELAEDEDQLYWEGSVMPTEGWVDGIASQGIFECPENLELRYGESNIPEGWSVNSVTYGRKEEVKAQILSVAGKKPLNPGCQPGRKMRKEKKQ